MSPEQVVQEFTDAWNAHDVDRAAACFSEDAPMTNEPGGVLVQGQKAIRAHFGDFIPNSPDLHADVLSRIHVDAWVVQEERCSGLVFKDQAVPTFDIVVAYRVEDGKIVKSICLQP